MGALRRIALNTLLALSLDVTPRGTTAKEQFELYRKLIQDKGIKAD